MNNLSRLIVLGLRQSKSLAPLQRCLTNNIYAAISTQIYSTSLHQSIKRCIFNSKKQKNEQEKEQTKQQEEPKKEKEAATEQKKAEEKPQEQQKQQQQTEVKKEEPLPDSIDKLVELNTPEAKKKIVALFKKLEGELKQKDEQVKDFKHKLDITNKANDDYKKKIQDLRKNLQQELDDIELTRKRLTKEKEETKIFAISKFAKDILEVSFNLEKAIESSKTEYEGKNNDLFEGTTLTYKVLQQILNRNGVKQINPEKLKFNPQTHEAMLQIDDPNLEPGTVANVIQVGYSLGDRVLKPPKVVVVKSRPKPVQKEAKKEEAKKEEKKDDAKKDEKKEEEKKKE